jgi:type I restriction enzyme M protein
MRWIAAPPRDTAAATLETRLWEAADQLRANSGLTAAQDSQPVLGLNSAEATLGSLPRRLSDRAAAPRRGYRGSR